MKMKPSQAIGHTGLKLPSHINAAGDPNFPLTLLAAFCIAVSRLSHYERLVVACEIEPRHLPSAWASVAAIEIIPFAVHLNQDLQISQFVADFAVRPPEHHGLSLELLANVNEDDVRALADVEYRYHEFANDAVIAPPRRLGSLFLEISRSAGAYNVLCSFDRFKFTPFHVEAILRLWQSLCENEPEPGITLKELCPLDSAERHRVLVAFNDTDHEYPHDKCVPDLLMDQARKRPHEVAVVCDGQRLTFAELAGRSARIASALRTMGVKPDDVIGIFAEPSLDLIIGIWGILFSGAAYMPLSPEYPEARLRYMIGDSRTKLIVAQSSLKQRIQEFTGDDMSLATVDEINDLSPTLDVGEAPTALEGRRPNHLAYVIYTSGSTGRPKGVMVEHRSIVNQMAWLSAAFQLERELILQKTPMSFDAAQWELLAPACGSVVVMAGPGLYQSPQQLVAAIVRNTITVLQCVPTLLRALLDTKEIEACTSLTRIFVGGEVLSTQLVSDCHQLLPNTIVINLYGPTECTINTSAFVTEPGRVPSSDTIPIGQPIYNTRYYILDRFGTPAAIGQIGDLYIGGAGLARGYLHHPELTSQRFITNPFSERVQDARLYHTGDLACWNSDGTVQYCGRADNQVKLRGHRVELDEIKVAIETHDWVRAAAVVVKKDSATGCDNLIAFIELDPNEAALMDQGNHDIHHQSKESKAQVLMQLANQGCRDKTDLQRRQAIDLPGQTPTETQRREVFARKSYRFYEGGPISCKDILELLGEQSRPAPSRSVADLSFSDFGAWLRYFGQYLSSQRLLPKYSYASPGALYATQLYLEIDGLDYLNPGFYYYYPVTHQLSLIQSKPASGCVDIKVHFIGKRSAIEPIYKHNIQEVLEIEAGHMIGLLETVLSRYGLGLAECEYSNAAKAHFDVAEEDFYLGCCQFAPASQGMECPIDLYVQVHPGRIVDLRAGQYQYLSGKLVKVSDELIARRHVIAINQAVYDRAAFGITIISRTDKPWLEYINLGRELQRLQMNRVNLGFMSSGYSSKSGHDLPSARKIRAILGKDLGPSYFCVGGRISDEQRLSEGMKEDAVHMKGPAEMIKDDLVEILPAYMIPNKTEVLDRLPLTSNGKVDRKKLEEYNIERMHDSYVGPRTAVERDLVEIWQAKLRQARISVTDNFFEMGGDSLLAVGLVNEINEQLDLNLPVQILFKDPTIEKLAHGIESEKAPSVARVIALHEGGPGNPVYCWPGLGGYCGNLRTLARKAGMGRHFYGVQAHGINQQERPFPTISRMAAEDVLLIRRLQPEGPYTLWGYSFGARVAFEAAYQLEQAGSMVESLVLIAPGSPSTRGLVQGSDTGFAEYSNKVYVAMLFSVFMGSIRHEGLQECLRVAHDEESFVQFIVSKNSELRPDIVKKVMQVVAVTYEFRHSLSEIRERRLNAPIVVIKARGDEPSFLEKCSESAPAIVTEIDADHYTILKEPDVHQLVHTIQQANRVGTNDAERSPVQVEGQAPVL